jgi:hypothetical protein
MRETTLTKSSGLAKSAARGSQKKSENGLSAAGLEKRFLRKGSAVARHTEHLINHQIIHRELDKKTYFNALERMLISPSVHK